MSILRQAIYQPRLAIRLQLIVATSLVCLLVLAGFAFFGQYELMWNARVDTLRTATEQAVSIAGEFERRVHAGELTSEQALRQFRDTIRPIRYNGKAGYLFAYGMDGNTLVLGPTPALEGTNRLKVHDANGKLWLQDMIMVARKGGGTVTYSYPKPGATVAQPKLAYVRMLPAWNMFVATGLYVDDLRTDAIATLIYFATIVGLLLALCIVVAWLVARGITRPLSRLRRNMMALANGEADVKIADTRRRDEIGEMAGAVMFFQEQIAEAARLRGAQEEARLRATTEQKAVLRSMADNIEAATATALSAVAESTRAMTAGADAMSASATQSGAAAQNAASAANAAQASAQTVASAAEQLNASILEISHQVQESTRIVREAVAAGGQTRAAIGMLEQEVGRVDEVAAMIGTIARRTNLLALNATIEAARAGEAGLGFAVVASEVKDLANQTGRSTKEIGRLLAGVRATTAGAASAVAGIEAAIERMNAIAGSIAVAIEEQGAATSEIARSIGQTASAASLVSDCNANVMREAVTTGRQAAELRGQSGGLDASMQELRMTLTRALRNSAPEIDRRADPRVAADLACSLDIAGQPRIETRMNDVSASGTSVGNARSLTAGLTGQMRIAGLGAPLAFAVVDQIGGVARLRFTETDDVLAELRALVQRLGAQSGRLARAA